MNKEQYVLGSQEIEYYPEKNVILTTIDELFHTAGNIFRWRGDPHGIGLNEKIINFAIDREAIIAVKVTTERKYYAIHSKDWKDFSDKHNSFHVTKTKAGNPIKLYVCQASMFNITEGSEVTR